MKKTFGSTNKLKRMLAMLLTMLIVLSAFPVDVQAVKVRENEEYEAGKTLRPISEMFHLDRILEWKPWSSPDDHLNRASVPLRERFVGHVVNPLASAEAKIQSVPLMNSKNDEDNSVNGDEFDSFAFDFWQYVDQMVFWDGPVPTADIIDAGHRNGVPVYGTLFFNWSASTEDIKILETFLQSQMKDGKKVYPVADKLVDIVEFYGFDGYFINQETSHSEPWGQEMRDFMLYAQRKAKEKNKRIRFSWYDAMANDGGRTHYNAVTSGNDFFVRKYGDDKQYASDEFFMNFNWGLNIDSTVKYMKEIDRSPFDAYAGLELQQSSLNTLVRYEYLIGQDKKLKVSLGLYTPDSIRGLAKNPEEYHEQERNFWVGFDGDPTTSGDENSKGKKWRGMARFVADKSAIMELPFNTYFNTGHGRQWFIDGALSKDAEWNSRGVQELLPTWRWWIRSNGSKALQARYDFDDAYNSGNSLRFYGNVASGDVNKIMLYSTKLGISADTKLKVTYKGGKNSKVFIDLGTAQNYAEDGFQAIELPKAEDGKWETAEVAIGNLVGQTLYSIRLRTEATEADSNYVLNLGQLALYNSNDMPQTVTDAKIDEVMFRASNNAEARLSWTPVADAEYYEVYQQNADGSKSIINATSSQYFYAEKIARSADMKGTTQELYVVSVGKNGVKSDPATIVLDWKMEVGDTGELPKPEKNLCLEAEVSGKSGENASEPARNAINGTISSNTDKWCIAGARSGWMTIRFPAPKTVRRVALYHAEAGGEGAQMNTRDFSIQYKDSEGKWQIAHQITGNTKAVTDFNLERPITAKEWKLNITNGDGSPWTAIRVYEWQMFEFTKENRTDFIPMRWAKAINTEDNHYYVSFKNVPKDTTVKLYRDKEMKELITEKTKEEKEDFLVFEDLELEIPQNEKYGKLYYTTKEANKEESLRMTLVYEKRTAKIQEVKLIKVPEKKVYPHNAPLRVGDGRIQVKYDNGDSIELTLLSSMVKGFDSSVAGEQVLEVEYKGIKVAETFTVKVKGENEKMEIIKIKIKQLPKTQYFQDEELDLTDGIIEAFQEDLEVKEVEMTDDEVDVTGFDSSEIGVVEVGVFYEKQETSFNVYINEKEKVNKEKLEEVIGQAKQMQAGEMYEKAEEAVKQEFIIAIEEAKVVFEDEEATKEQVADAVVALTKASEKYLNDVVKSVIIKQEPTKKEYQFGEEFSTEGALLEVTYGNDRKADAELTAEMITFNNKKVGTQVVEVMYKGYSAGNFEVKVMPEETEAYIAVREALQKAKETLDTDTYKNASKAAQEALNNIIEKAERILETGGEEEMLKLIANELAQAVLDLTRPIEPLLPYIPQQPETPSTPAPKTETIVDEPIAQAPATKALLEELTKTVTGEADKTLIKEWVEKKVDDKELVKNLSENAVNALGETFVGKMADETKAMWYTKELSVVHMLGLVEGYEDNSFRAGKEVTGQELVTMLVRMAKYPVEAKVGENWFDVYEASAKKKDLLKNVNFDLVKGLSRQEVAQLIKNYLVSTNNTTTTAKEMSFKDIAKIEKEYQQAVDMLVAEGIIKGYEDNTFRPEQKVTRAEIVVILYRLLKK